MLGIYAKQVSIYIQSVATSVYMYMPYKQTAVRSSTEHMINHVYDGSLNQRSHHACWYIISSVSESITSFCKQRAMIKMGNTYCVRVPSHFALKKSFSLTFQGH